MRWCGALFILMRYFGVNEMTEPAALEQGFRQNICDFPGAAFKCTLADSEWDVTYISSFIKDLTGYDSEAFLEREISLENIVHPEDRENFSRNLTHSLEHDSHYLLQYRIIHAEGHLKWVCESGKGKPGYREGLLLENPAASQGKNWQYLATHDTLTQLPNRTLFYDRLHLALAKAKRTHWPMALFFVDLDDFKTVNDTWGHLVGDYVLRTVARRLKDCLRESDTIARIGGDEFIILLENTAHEFYTTIIAEKIQKVLGLPITLDNGKTLTVGGSIGISPFIEGDRAETLLQKADAAMYQAKKQGKHNFQIYGKLAS